MRRSAISYLPRTLTLLVAAAALSPLSSAVAATYQWDVNGAAAGLGGTGTWDTTNTFWDLYGTAPDDGSATTGAYTFTSTDTALFAGTAGTVTLASGVTVNGLTFNTAGYTVTGNTLTLAGTTPTITANANATLASVVTGSAGLTKTGSGTLTLSGANTYTGGTVITGGTVQIAADSGLGAAPGSATPGNITLNGGTLQITAGNQTINANRGLFVGAAGGTIIIPGGNTTYNMMLTGSGPLTLSGNGQFSASGASPSYTGNVTLTGDIRFSTSSGNSLGTGTITVVGTNTHTAGTGAQLYAASSTFTNNFIISGFGGNSGDSARRGALRLDGSTANGTITLAGDASIGSSAGPGTVNGKVTGGYTLHINATGGGSGTIILTNSANDYTGGTSVNLGTLGFSNGSLGTTGTVTMRAGTTLMWNAGNTQDISSRLSLVGNSTFNTNGNDVTFASALNGGVAVTKTGAGTLKLNAVATYTGNTTISGGTLDLSGTGGIYNVAVDKSGANSIVINGGGVLVGDRWDWGSNQSLGKLNFNSGNIAVDNGTIRNVAAASTGFASGAAGRGIAVGAGGITYENATVSTTWTIGAGGSANTYANNAAVRLAGAGDGILAQAVTGTGVNIVKSGAGTWNLTAANNYTGSTVVNAGTLTIGGASGAITGSGAITVARGATLTIDNSTASLTDRVGSGAISLSGTLNYFHTGAAATNYSETLGSVSSAGGTIITSQAALGQTSELTLGGLTGAVNFLGTGLGLDSRNRVLITGMTAGTSVGTYNSSGIAVYDTTNGVIEATYADVPFAGVIADGASTNIRLTGGTSGDVTLGSSVTTVNAIVQNQTSPTTIDAASKTLRLSAKGVVALASGMGALTIGTAANSGTLTAGGADNTPGTLSLVNHDATAALTVNSVIANNGTSAVTLITGGTGKVVLGGTNTFTGGITIGVGTLELGGAGTLGAAGSYSGAIANSGILRINTSANQTLTGVISGTGSLVKDGTGTLTLATSQSTFTGGTTVNQGKLILNNNGADNGSTRIAGALTINSGGTVETTGTGTNGTVAGLGWNGQISSLNINGGLLTAATPDMHIWNVGITMTGGTIQTNGGVSTNTGSAIQYNNLNTLTTLASANTATIAGHLNLRADSTATTTMNVADGTAPIDLLISAGITQSGGSVGVSGITKNGAGVLALSGANTYTGGTTVAAGILDLTGGGGSAGTIRGTVNVTGGAQLRLSAGDVTGYATDGSRLGVINLNGATNLSGTGTMHVNTTANQTLGNAAINLTGASITGVAGSNLDFFQGSSALNSLASGTTSTVSGVQLSIRQGAGLTVTVADGAAATDMRIASQIVASTKESNGYTAAPLIKDGAGLLELTGTNTYTGLTRVKAGALVIGSAGSLASGNALTLDSTGTAEFQNAGQTLGAVSNANTAVNALNFSANSGTVTLASLTGSGNTRFGNNATVTGGIASGTVSTVGALNANISGTAAVTAGGLLTGTLSGGTVGAGSLSSTAVTGGTNAITGAATITTLDGGTTTVGGVATIGTMTSGTANLNGATSAITTLNGGTVNLGTTTALTVNEGTFGGSITGGSLTKAGNGTLTLSGTSNTFNGLTVNAGKLTVGTANALGTGTVTVAGGELDLAGLTTNKAIGVTGGTVSGSSGYTGTLTFGGTSSAGLNGTFAGVVDLGGDKTRAYSSTGITVASTGTLQGQGVINGALTVQGHLNIGNSPGALTVSGNTTLTAASTSLFEIAGATQGTQYDFLSVNGVLTLDGTITVASSGSFNANTLIAGDSFDFINATTIDASGFNVATDLQFGSNMTLANGLQWDTSQFASMGVLSVTTAIPEPGTYGLFGAGALALATAVRRRRRA